MVINGSKQSFNLMKVLFVCSGNNHYSIVPFIKVQGESLKREGIEIEYFPVKGKGVSGYLKNIKPLKEFIRKNNFDIIHAHFGLIGLLCVLTHSKLPIVLSVMGDDAYGSFDLNGKRIKSSLFGVFLTQIALIFVRRIIVKSKNILNVIPYKNKSHIIPNGVDFDIFRPNSESLKKNSILFLADEDNQRKNYNLLKKALELINGPEITCINPYPIDHEEFPFYLNNCSVFVLTSYNEGSPNVIKEAMACNIPIVSTDVGDVKEVIGKTEGCFITTFEPSDVAMKIERALEYAKRTTGREDIKHLESGIIAHKIIDIYKQIIEK